MIGWTVGPFLVSFIVLAVQAALGWPKHPIVGFITYGLPLAFGLVCAALLYRPKGWNYLLAVPYCLAYGVAIIAVTIVYAIMLGAQK
jgi:hypothetical protein